MKISKEKQQQLIAVVIGTVAAVVAIYFLMISGSRVKIAERTKKIEEENVKITKAKRALLTRDQKLAMLGEMTNRLEELETDMVSKGSIKPSFLKVWNSFKKNYGNTIDSDLGTYQQEAMDLFEFSSPPFPYSIVAFRIEGTAHFHQFGKFVADFENKFPFFRVKSFGLTPEPARDAETFEKVHFSMVVSTLAKEN